MIKTSYDVIIVGAGVGGLFTALHLPREKQILILSKEGLRSSDSFLAQGGICMLRGDFDYDEYFEDTLRAGHYENNRDSVDLMLRTSQQVIRELVECGARFTTAPDGSFVFTREGAHTSPRILYHEDCTGKEITSHLLRKVQKLSNVTFAPHTTMLDILTEGNLCYGVVIRDNQSGELSTVTAPYTVLASGGIGGLFRHSTNFRHLTGDALAVCLKHGVELEHVDYIQIHPTTLYSPKRGRRFLISESVRGEGAILLDKNGNRFTDELQPRDVVSAAIKAQMEKDGTPYVLLDLRPIGAEEIERHFPTIVKKCREEGYDVLKEPIPVVPAQHYFMGGIRVDRDSRTTMERLYAVGETSCNGVHGRNRLASNSLLESLVFAMRAAEQITERDEPMPSVAYDFTFDPAEYADDNERKAQYKQAVLEEIEKEKNSHV